MILTREESEYLLRMIEEERSRISEYDCFPLYAILHFLDILDSIKRKVEFDL